MTRIKICGLSREEDIEAVNEAGPDYCGFIINFPKSHRNVTPRRVRELTEALSGDIPRVGVLVNRPVSEAAELIRTGTVDIIQLHGDENNAYIRELRDSLDRESLKAEIWKAYRVRSREDLRQAAESAADRVILDNGYGTGEMFDWSLLAGGKDLRSRPWLLAGGLTPENIPEAIRTLRPWGIDISSGVETDRRKDRAKILAAVSRVKAASKGSNLI